MTVEVWIARTPPLLTAATRASGILDYDEHERHRRLRRQSDRDTWLVAHVMRRCVLAALVDVKPDRLQFRTAGHPAGARNGKPWCPSAPAIDFSLSHAGSLSCFAVSSSGLVGIDVEVVPATPESDHVVATTMTLEEQHILARLPPQERPREFTTRWCRKEACTKATGAGGETPFGTFAGEPDGPSPADALDESGATADIAQGWLCQDLLLPKGYRGALAHTPWVAESPRVNWLATTDIARGVGQWQR